MSVTLTIRDETLSGSVYHEQTLELPAEIVTVREIIRERVYQEVHDFNRKIAQNPVYRGLIQPQESERVLNGPGHEYRVRSSKPLDWNLQFEKALEAFDQNRFLLLVDDVQAERLDQRFTLSSQTSVSFIRLTLLVGG